MLLRKITLTSKVAFHFRQITQNAFRLSLIRFKGCLNHAFTVALPVPRLGLSSPSTPRHAYGLGIWDPVTTDNNKWSTRRKTFSVRLFKIGIRMPPRPQRGQEVEDERRRLLVSI